MHSFRYACLVTTSFLSPILASVHQSGTSATTGFPNVTGGEYKIQERIHRTVADVRLLAIPAS
jgi:hypothetical protein